MAAEEILWIPGEWNLGEVVQIDRNGKLIVRGRIKEVIGSGLYKIDVEEGGIRAKSK